MSSIPMQIRSPDILGQMARGAQTAGIQNNIVRENRLMDLYRTQGPGIAAGETNALDALARHDPAQAMGIQQSHRKMEITEENLRMTRERFRMAAEADARKASAAEAAAAAQEIERIVAMAVASPENADQIFASDEDTKQFVGMDPRIAAAGLLGLKDALEMAQGADTPAAMQTLEARAAAAGLLPGSPEYQQFMLEGGKKAGGLVVETTPEGGTRILQGSAATGGGSPPKMTVDAAKNTGFYIRTKDAHETITGLENQGLEFLQQAADAIPLGLGNYLRTPEFQKFDQARRDFVNAILRRESGATISDQEFDSAEKQYFPQPGDSPEVIQQKRRNRANAIEGLRVGSGAGAGYVDQQQPSDVQPMTFEAFAADPSAQAAATKYGVSLEEMWAIKQANDG